MRKLTVDVCPGDYAIFRFAPDAELPDGLLRAPGLVSVTRTADEISVVCLAGTLHGAQHSEEGWRLLTVRGPLEFSLTGIMATLSGELASAGVTLLALSTYDTDHLLVRETDLRRAVAALREGGHEVPFEPSAAN